MRHRGRAVELDALVAFRPAVEMVEEMLLIAWQLEGGLLRAVADAPAPDRAALEQIVDELKKLEAVARAAHGQLSAAL